MVFWLTLGNGSWPHLKTKAPKIKACTVLKGKRNGGKVWFAEIFLFFRHRAIPGVIAPRFKPGKPSSKSHLLGRICRSRRTKLTGNIYTFHIRKSCPIHIHIYAYMCWAILIYHRLPKGGDGWPWQQLKSALASFFLQKLESSSSQGMSQLFLEEPRYKLHHPDKTAIFASFHRWKSTTDIFVYWFFWNLQQRFILPKRFISQIFRLFLILRL